MSIFRFVTRFSVRTRIVALAIIPVIGFLANGIAYTVSETEVAGAFDSVKRHRRLPMRGRNSRMRSPRCGSARETSPPGRVRIGFKSFEDSYQRANMSLVAIERALPESERQEILGLRARLSAVKNNFDNLVKGQGTLGFTDEDGPPPRHTRFRDVGRTHHP